MTPQFYARYVPNRNATTTVRDADNLEGARPPKKRRKHNDLALKNIDTLKDINLNETFGSDQQNPTTNPLKDRVEDLESKRLPVKLADGTHQSDKAQKGAAQKSSQKGTNEKSSLERSGQSPHTYPEDASPEPDFAKAIDHVRSSAGVAKKKKKEKKEKDGRNANDSKQAANGQADTGSKYINILSKYQKSVNAAAEPAKINDNLEDTQETAATAPEIHGLTPIPQPLQVPDPTPISTFSALPAWLTKPVVASRLEPLAFDSLPLNPSTLDSLKAKGLTEAFTIQAAVLPLLLPGERQHLGDLCISASTGSGKTLAYALPIVEALRDKPITRLRGLIVVPTRELVNQVREVLELCSSGSGLKVGTAYGSKTLREEKEALITWQQRYDPDAYAQEQDRKVDEEEELLNWDIDLVDEQEQTEERLIDYVEEYTSSVDILICTPGRLVEHLQRTRGFSLDHIQWLVIDEADGLLDENFQQWVDSVVPALEHQSPPSSMENQMMQRFHLLRKREVRKIILSATMTRDISKLNELKLRRPKLVVLQSEKKPKQTGGEIEKQAPPLKTSEEVELPTTLQEAAVQIKDEENKPLYLIELLKQLSSKQPRRLNRQLQEKADNRKDFNTSNAEDSDSVSSCLTDSSSPHSYSNPSISSSSSGSSSDSDVPQSDPGLGSSAHKVHGFLVFAHSTSSAHRLSRLISILSPDQALGTATLTKSSAKSSKRILSQFQANKLNIIISTDRASRGLDIPNLAHVINYDVPPSVNSYVHRVGRTARAGKIGKATTLVGWREGRWFWNEIGRGQGIQRGASKVTRQALKEEGWDNEELHRYAEALRQLGEETHGELK
ncbi:MAG: hypothetical protein Q9225_001338 [Loekoesia sp. 1 TL-2023]